MGLILLACAVYVAISITWTIVKLCLRPLGRAVGRRTARKEPHQ